MLISLALAAAPSSAQVQIDSPDNGSIYCLGDSIHPYLLTVDAGGDESTIPPTVYVGDIEVSMEALGDGYYDNSDWVPLEVPGYIEIWAGYDDEDSDVKQIDVVQLLSMGPTDFDYNQDRNYLIYKTESYDYATVTAYLNPNDDAVAAAVLSWSGGDPVAGHPRQRQVKKWVVAKTPITVSCCSVTNTVTIWVIKIYLIRPSRDPVSLPCEGENEFTFTAANPGVLTINLEAQVDPAGAADLAKGACCFLTDTIAGSTRSWSSRDSSGDSLVQTVTFTGLPAANSSFGAKTAQVYFNGLMRDEQSYEVFFDGSSSAKNHPGAGAGVTPNWFFYWKQTSANAGDMHYDATKSRSYCDWDNPNYTCYLTSDDNGSYETPDVGANANTTVIGIDNFAWTARHEWQHHQEKVEWWGAGGYNSLNDLDTDGIPDSVESDPSVCLPGGRFDWRLTQTYADDRIENDGEMTTVCGQEVWTIGGADLEDWSNTGNQH
jgi:hypothetical protein